MSGVDQSKLPPFMSVQFLVQFSSQLISNKPFVPLVGSAQCFFTATSLNRLSRAIVRRIINARQRIGYGSYLALASDLGQGLPP